MDARIATSLGKGVAITDRETVLLNRVRELQRQLLRVAAVGMVAAIWMIVPIGGLSGIYYMSGSPIAPLCLAGIIIAIVSTNYYLLSRMLIASEELNVERPHIVVTDTAAPLAFTRRLKSEDSGREAIALQQSRKDSEDAEGNTIAPAA